MAYICEQQIIENGVAVYSMCVERLDLISQLSITREQMFILMTSIGSLYVVLLSWSVIMLIYRSSK